MAGATIGIHCVRLVRALDDHVIEVALLTAALIFIQSGVGTAIYLLALHAIVDLGLDFGLVFALLATSTTLGDNLNRLGIFLGELMVLLSRGTG